MKRLSKLALSYNMLIQLKKQCLGLLSLWQCFPLLRILWRKLLLSLQTKSPAAWTIGRAFVFRSGSRYDKVFSNISHSNIIKERIHWYSLKKLAAHLYSGVGHTLLGLAKWLYPVCNWIVPWSLEVIHLWYERNEAMLLRIVYLMNRPSKLTKSVS